MDKTSLNSIHQSVNVVSGVTGISWLTSGLANLASVQPGACSDRRQEWKIPKRTPWQCTASVCSRDLLLGKREKLLFTPWGKQIHGM